MPDTVEKWAAVVGMAEEAVKDRKTPEILTILGATQYRAGQYQEAIRTLAEAQALDQSELPALNAIFFALAHHAVDPKGKEYLAWRTKADKLLEIPAPKGSWDERIELMVLGRELKKKGASPQGDN